MTVCFSTKPEMFSQKDSTYHGCVCVLVGHTLTVTVMLVMMRWLQRWFQLLTTSAPRDPASCFSLTLSGLLMAEQQNTSGSYTNLQQCAISLLKMQLPQSAYAA